MENTINTASLDQYSINTLVNQSGKSELGQDEFMKLMLAQLQSQDPFKPADNGEFIAQMAQFSTVAGIDEMNNSLQALSSSLGNYQTLQYANLVGRSVLVSTNTFNLNEENSVEGVYKADSTSSVTASIYNSAGEVVHQIDLGIQGSGQHAFAWDGLLEDGSRVEPGDYLISIDYGTDEAAVSAEVMIKQEIESVNLSTNNGETVLNTVDGLSLTLSEIDQIY